MTAGEVDRSAPGRSTSERTLKAWHYALAALGAAALTAAVQALTLVPARAAPKADGAGPLQGAEVVELLRAYLRVDTSNPPGNEARGARFFKELFDREGIPSEIYTLAPGRDNIIARLEGTGKKKGLLLLNHMDVVNPERPYWTVDPFGGELRDGYVYGRGALDMKTAGFLEAVTLINLKRTGARLSRDIVFLGTADEEVSAIGINWVVDQHPELLDGIEFALNEGGVIDAIDGEARYYNVAVTEKVPFWLRLTARGRPGHGSQPFTRDNAVLALLRALDRLSRHETAVRVTPAAEAYFRGRAAGETAERAARFRDIRAAIGDPEFRRALLADPALNAILRDTIAVTMLQGAPQTNIIPTVAAAQIDIRLLPGTDPQAFLEEIRRVLDDPSLSIETIGSYLAATESPVDSEVVRAIDRARQRHHPGAVLVPSMLTGWTESAAVRSLGIEAYGFEPFVLSESEQDRAHGNDERISVDNVLLGATIMEDVVRDIGR